MTSLFEYTAYGPESGGCGHRHRTQTNALGCQRRGTDRRIVTLGPDEPTPIEPENPEPVQARYAGTVWKLVVASVVAESVRPLLAGPTVEKLFESWPTAAELAAAPIGAVTKTIHPIRNPAARARTVARISFVLSNYAEQRGKTGFGWPPTVGYLERFGAISGYVAESYRLFVLEESFEPSDPILAGWVRRGRMLS